MGAELVSGLTGVETPTCLPGSRGTDSYLQTLLLSLSQGGRGHICILSQSLRGVEPGLGGRGRQDPGWYQLCLTTQNTPGKLYELVPTEDSAAEKGGHGCCLLLQIP